MNISAHAKGLILAAGGVVVLSPDSLLIRYVEIDLWTLMFLRGLFMAVIMLVVNRLFGNKSLAYQLGQLDYMAYGLVFLLASSSFFFVAAIQTTSVAHTLVIVGTAPMLSALLGIFLLHEPVRKNTWLTLIVVFCALIFVVWDQQASTLLGDFYALITGLAWALVFIFARRTRLNNMFIPMMLSGAAIALISLPLASFDQLSVSQTSLGSLIGMINGLALCMITFAPRYIPAAEAAVFMPLESVLGSLLVWWLLGEYPGLISVIGGLVIIGAIMMNSLYQLKRVKLPTGVV